MIKNYCVISSKYRKFKDFFRYTFEKTLFCSIIFSKWDNTKEKYLRKKNQWRYQKFLI